MEHICSLCPYLLSHCDAAEAPRDGEEAAALGRSLLREAQRGRVGAEAAALRFDCLRGLLNCPFDDDNDAVTRVVRESDLSHAADLTRDDAVSFARVVLLRATLLRSLLLHAAGGADGGAPEPRRWCAGLLAHDYFLEQVAALAYDCAVVRSLHDGYAYVSTEPPAPVAGRPARVGESPR